jgi:hypothetical protein
MCLLLLVLYIFTRWDERLYVGGAQQYLAVCAGPATHWLDKIMPLVLCGFAAGWLLFVSWIRHFGNNSVLCLMMLPCFTREREYS